MKTEIVVTGILKSNDKYLIVKRADDDYDETYPSAWEYPGGHLEYGETVIQGLKRELKEEINFDLTTEPQIINFYDEIRERNGEKIHFIEFDFLINVNEEMSIKLSNEHSSYNWVTKDSKYMIDFLKRKIKNTL